MTMKPGIAFADTNVLRGQEPGSPCYFKGSDQEGGTLATRTSFWPPGVTCVHRGRSGDVTEIEVDQWPWIPAFVWGCVSAAVLPLGAGVLRVVTSQRATARAD